MLLPTARLSMLVAVVAVVVQSTAVTLETPLHFLRCVLPPTSPTRHSRVVLVHGQAPSPVKMGFVREDVRHLRIRHLVDLVFMYRRL